MGMTWSEYKAYREKKKKEEEQAKAETKKNTSSNKTSVTPSTYRRTVQPSVTQTIQNNNNLASNIIKATTGKTAELQSVKIASQKELEGVKKEKEYNNSTTWGQTMNFFKNIGRAIDNAKNGAINGIVGSTQTVTRDTGDVENTAYNISSGITKKIFGNKNTNNLFVVNTILNNKNEQRQKDIQNLQEIKEENNKNIQNNITKAKITGDSVGTKLTELAPSVGQQIPGMALNALSPVATFAYFKTSAEANYYDDAKERGMSESESKIYSKLMSYVEAGTETLSVGNITKGGKTIKALAQGTKNAGIKAGLDIFEETAKEETANTIKSALKDYGIGIAEEAFQEAITEPIQEFTAMKVAGEDKADWNNMWQRMLQSGVDGALSSAIIAGANMGISSCQGIVTKINNGENISTQEYQNAVKDASEKVDVQKLVENGIKNEVSKLNSQQNTDNYVINQETKTPQNPTSQAQNDAKTQTTTNLAKVRQFYDEDTYNQMKNFIETAPSEEALNQINEDIKTETKNKLEEVYKSERFTESQDRKRTYAQYQRQNNTTGINYDNSVVDNALDTIPANRNDRRTVGQWKQVAEQIGLNSADLTKSQIDDIAYGSWFDLQPTKNITQYDNRSKEHKGFEKFTSDDWINTIYESVKGQKIQKLDTILNNEVATNQAIGLNQEQNQLQEQNRSKIKKISRWALDKFGNLRPFKQQIKDYLNGNIKSGDSLILDDGSIDLSYADVKNEPIVVFQRNASKVINIKHSNIPIEIIENLNSELANSVLAMDSYSYPNSKIIVLDKLDNNGNPIIATIHEGKSVAAIEVNDLTSVYDKKEFQNFINNTQKAGGKFYTNNKTTDWLLSVGLQLPENFTQSVVLNNSIQQNNQNVKSDNTNINNMQNNQENIQQKDNNNTKGETINWNEIERTENNQKFRKHYRSIIESDQTTAEAKSIAKELMGTDTYVPETNKGQLAQADQRIMTSSPETELQSLLSRSMNGEKISSVDIAVGERLIQYFSKTGSKQQLQEAIQATAMAGTSAGQTVQALSMLNHQTPQGQATWIQRSVDKMNKELAKKKGGTITTDTDGNLQVINKQGQDITNKVDLFNLTPEMIDKIMSSENQEQMYKNIDEVYEELGQEVPKSMLEKVDSWRYFSMLANARTHIRNMVGNVAMGKMQRVKDKIAGGIEGVVSQFNPNMERTKTLVRADKKTRNFAKQDFKNMEVQSRLELNENKYNPQSRLQNARRTFKSDVMENTLGRLFNLNDSLLEAEDGLGLKAGYQKALTDYITANKINVDNITDAQLNKARNYAIQQAKEATFHQANAIASAVTQFQNKNKATKFFVDALLPFKKTPMNVAKAGMEYSPLQIAKSATIDVVNLRKGNISINQYIDNLAKGMTGTGIALAGYALAKAGILKASGSDDKDKEKYDEEQGKQSYSIEIAGKTYSLDWLAPTGIPLFIGAETFKLFNQEDTEKSTEKSSEEDKLKQAIKGATNLLNAGATAINPMSEMSMISGLTSALSSYNTSDNLGSLGNMMTNMGKSYVNQFFPTLMGQVAKTGDEYERTTKSTATGTIGKAVDQTINQVKAKIPGLRQTLPIKTDIWGNDVKQEVNLPLRAVNNFLNPATVKEVSTDKVDMELNKLYEENKNSSLLPDILTKTVQLNKQTYRLTNKEYAEATKQYGQTAHKLIENFIKTSDYNKLTQEQKETAIADIYSYAKEKNKLDYAKKVGEEVKESTLYTTMKAIEKAGGKQSEYLSYLAKTKGMSKESEKNKVLADSNYSNKTKEIIYTNGTGKDDKLYNELLSKSNINMTEYLDYKNKVSAKEFSADKDSNGKTVAGSAKNKVISYLNNNITGVGNRLLIAGKSYALQNSEKQKLAQCINQIASTKEERMNIYKQLDKNFVVKDGKVYIKVSK